MHSPRTWPAKTEFAKLYYVPFNKMIVKQADVIPLTACVTTEGIKGHGMFFYSQGYRDLGERYAKEMIQLLEEVHADGKNGIDSMIAPLFTPSAPVQMRFQPFPAKNRLLVV